MEIIRQSGLFLSDWYISQTPPAAQDGAQGILHFCLTGWREGLRPNPYFETGWYMQQNPDVAAGGLNPLVHYIIAGEGAGQDPSPWFFTTWYRQTYHIPAGTSCLAHYLRRRMSGQVSPVPIFDAAWYLDHNRDVATGKGDPFEHFINFGVQETRDPAPDFDIKFYLARYSKELQGKNPLLHYLANRDSGLFLPRRSAQEAGMAEAVRQAMRPAAFFEEFSPLPAHAPRKAKLLAYYLPQFHRVSANDAWWGKGFTDWTNLGRALPRFVGHRQPRVPRDLGYYSLDDPQTLKRQIDMARQAGLAGFVFYYYWFNRQRLLEKPLEQFIADKTLDFSFCVMWANENWTRRWDGLEREVLIAQEYLEEDDEALVASFARLFADTRYIRIEGRPLLMIYRLRLIPNAVERLRKWRDLFKKNHNETPLIIMAQSMGDDYDPTPYELDGAVEFPPHKLSQQTARINEDLELLDPEFSATVHDYAALAETSLKLPVPDYPLIKAIVPGWDNDPRREGKGLALHHVTPEIYQHWLENLIEYTKKNKFYGERIVCINAWNEWAEGAFLEPDLHAGAAFLNATSRAVSEHQAQDLTAGILLVGHDAHPHGAQLLLLHIARQLKRQWGLKVYVLLLGVGPLLASYEDIAEVTIAYDKTLIGTHLDRYRRLGIRRGIVNSAASSRVVPWAQAREIDCILLIHELPQILKEYSLEIQTQQCCAAAKSVVYSSEFGAQACWEMLRTSRENEVILPQGEYLNITFDAQVRVRMRANLGLKESDYLIIGAGFGYIRKGFDLFLQLARRVTNTRKDVRFLWVGDIEFRLKTYLEPEMAVLQADGKFIHIPMTSDLGDYFCAADVMALTSREDPLPTVVMQALACGLPCVAFDKTGGIPDLLRAENAGYVAHPADLDDYQHGLLGLLNHKKLQARKQDLINIATEKFDFPRYVNQLVALVAPDLKQVSVAVINYNYARYLPARLQSIFAQTYPVREILFLDDASQDDSLAVARALAKEAQRDMTFIGNAENSGSVCAQWRRAALAAKGEYLWLCEADDTADPEFLSSLVEALEQAASPLLVFAESRAVDAQGQEIMSSYQGYYAQSGALPLLMSGVWETDEFARRFLSKRNLILNVSAVLWRREALLQALDQIKDLEDWKLAGDWRVYLQLMMQQKGQVVYVAKPLNTHRRHDGGITETLDASLHFQEIEKIHNIIVEKMNVSQTEQDELVAERKYLAKKFRLDQKRQTNKNM